MTKKLGGLKEELQMTILVPSSQASRVIGASLLNLSVPIFAK